MKLPIVATAMLLAGASAPQPALQTAVLAGGCFWGMEAVFEHVKGVRDVVSGYAGGSGADATYAKVSSERTKHAEVVRIRFDPSQISYSDLLRIYFAVAHDPTQVNRQGPDVGASYRSAIFPQSAEQHSVAAQWIKQLSSTRRIVTRLESGSFYPAEAYHQDFARRNPTHGYIVVYDKPKVAKLKRSFPQYWKS